MFKKNNKWSKINPSNNFKLNLLAIHLLLICLLIIISNVTIKNG
jgi:hypothetical protein